MITAAQIRMAQSALNWSTTRLAQESGVHRNTIHRAARGEATKGSVALLQHTFERAGVAFTNGDEPGVKLRREG